MADRTVVVDGTTSGTPGTNGAHYATLSAAISGEVGAAPDLVSGAAILTIECSGNVSDTTAVDVVNFTTDSTHYVKIVTPVANRHAGIWSASKYRLEVANPAVAVLRIRQEYTRIEGLQIRKSGSNANDQMLLQIDPTAVGATVYASDCIIRNNPSDAFRAPNIWVVSANVTAYLWNNICYGSPDVVSPYASAVMVEAGTAYVYSCTAIGGFAGMVVSGGATANAKNSYFAENSTDGSAVSLSVTGTFNQTTCAASDASGLVNVGLQNIAINTTNFTNVTPGSDDWHLPSGSALIDVGTNTSGESAPLNFVTDIDGQTRTGTWDIGADSRETVSVSDLSVSLQEAQIGGSVF